MRAPVLFAVLLLAPLASAIAQDQPVRLGDRVRVTAPSLGVYRYVARFEYLRGDTLVVRADSSVKCPLSTVTQLEVSRGRSNTPVFVGAGLGTTAGAVIGFAIAPQKECDPLDILCSEYEQKLMGAIAGGLGGALAGAVLGAAVRTDRWEDVPLDRMRVRVARLRGRGLALEVSIRF